VEDGLPAEGTATPSNNISELVVKLVPATVTWVPAAAVVGETLEIAGTGLSTVNSAPFEPVAAEGEGSVSAEFRRSTELLSYSPPLTTDVHL
jgi:hypothetical protein